MTVAFKEKKLRLAFAISVSMLCAICVDAKAEAVNVAAPPSLTENAEHETIVATIESWLRAWSRKDIEAYLSFYSTKFRTPDGEPHGQWKSRRTNRILDKDYISVRMEFPVVAIHGNTATVKYRQIYASDRLKEESDKTLKLVKQKEKWFIVQEWSKAARP